MLTNPAGARYSACRARLSGSGKRGIYRHMSAAPLSPGSRSAARHPLRVGYNGLIDDVNRELRRLIFFFSRIHFWKHRGMLLDGCSLLGADGTHLDPRGARLYFRSIRGAVLFLSKR